MFGGAASVVHTLHGAAIDNPFLVWNTLLALIPLAFAVALFRDGVRSGALWWAGVVAWVLLLPNAPYVLTDSVHLFDDIRNSSNSMVYFGLLPVYGAFFLIGFSSYVMCLRLAHRWAVARGRGAQWFAIETMLHALCAVGVYLGRFVRLNSWDVVVSPSTVTGTLDDLARRFPLAIMFVTFVVLAVGTFVVNAVLAASADSASRLVAGIGRSHPRKGA
ncbi:MAG: hypothetical protein QOI55_2985 [Actinomycetota bacterium]|jgi:uncharacterized membrane protein|nr:hypothetical protein [Actinomycetota bacterium]